MIVRVDDILVTGANDAEHLDNLAKADTFLLARPSALESTNDQTVRAVTADLEKKIHGAVHKLEHLSKAEIQSVRQQSKEQQVHLENMGANDILDSRPTSAPVSSG